MKNIGCDWVFPRNLSRGAQVERVKRAIKRELTPRQQEIVRMVFYEHLSQAEAARRMGLNRSTVCRTLHRAEQRLRKYLQY